MKRRGWDLARATRKLSGKEENPRAVLARIPRDDLLRLEADFESWAHPSQRPPRGEGWRTWLILAGRGFGKTRAGSEWICRQARGRGGVRIALVGASEAEVRKVMIEGPSGLIAVSRLQGLRPNWEPSLGKLSWTAGGEAHVHSAENPDGLRGPEYDFAWCDELAKWRLGEETWTNLQMGLRRGASPRAVVTTTPRPTSLLKRIDAEAGTVTTRGRMDDNLVLPAAFRAIMRAAYGGTRIGRQELDGELIADLPGALWTRDLVEKCRGGSILPGTSAGLDCPRQSKSSPGDWTTRRWWQPEGLTEGGADPRPSQMEGPLHHAAHGPPPRPGEDLKRVVVGVDPPASADGDACGIVVCGTDSEGIAWVIEDATVRGLSPEGWAAAVVAAAERWGAELVVAEANQGGEMVASVLRQADAALPVRPVRARYGKGQRAEPVALLFEQDKAKFAGAFPELEDELCGLIRGGGYEGPGRSPDRADACVWALAELTQRRRSEPRVVGL